MREFVRSLTEGATLWGTIDISPASGGVWRRVRLTVYPPGTTQAERRTLHFARVWPIAGAVVGVVLTVALSAAVPPAAALVAALIVYAAGFWVAVRLTRSLKRRVRTLTVASIHGYGELKTYGDARLLNAATARLDDLESRRRSGHVNPVQYEAEWGDVYETIPGATAALIQGRRRSFQ